VGYYSGSDGEMQIDEVKVAKVTSFSFTSNQETIDVTTLGDRDRKLVGGLRSLSGSATIAYYSANGATDIDIRAKYLIGKLIKTGGAVSETVSLQFGINDHEGVYKEIKFTAIITSIAMSSAQGEIFSADVSFEAADAPSVMDL